jgi:hypothetical protein
MAEDEKEQAFYVAVHHLMDAAHYASVSLDGYVDPWELLAAAAARSMKNSVAMPQQWSAEQFTVVMRKYFAESAQ